MEKILVVDSEVEIGQLLLTRLTILGYKVYLVSNGKDALTFFTQKTPDLILIDVVLPKLDGYEVCREIRKSSQVPLIILTSLSSISNRILGLELGADDYVIKPFSPNELEARIKSLMRRSKPNAVTFTKEKKQILKVGNLFIDRNIRKISKNNLEIKLTNIEYNILELLIENAGNELSRTLILDNIWGYKPERYVDTRIVDVHISRLRAKIEDDPRNPDLILTTRGIGYRFQQYEY
jgi:OmpR family response regulator RpaB